MLMSVHRHIWRVIETNEFGKPTKYKCINCPLERSVKSKLNLTDHFDTLNSICNRIKENQQKIDFIKLNPIGINEKLHISHLENEIKKLTKMYQFGV